MIDLSSFRKIGRYKIFKQGELVCMQNDPGDNMYVVLRGVFGVYINSFTDFPVRVAGIPEGAFFGEMSVIDGSPRSATIISEELGHSIAIDKDNFAGLVASNRAIAEKILTTLGGRAESTAEMARSKGVPVADLPPHLKNPVLAEDSVVNYENMLLLAKRIRELNELLGVGKSEEIEIKTDLSAVTLLPLDHKRFSEPDEFDNSKILAVWEYVCPYCKKGFKNRIPLFGRLVEKEKSPDYRITYDNFNILFYTNIVCPNCNYTDTYQEFQKEHKPQKRAAVDGNQFVNSENFTGFADERQHTLDEVILSYYLNLECLRQIPRSEFRQAKAWHKLFWIYSDINYEGMLDFAARKAISLYDAYAILSDELLSRDDYMTINTIIGELYLAIGEPAKAKEYFLKNTNVFGYTTHNLAKASLRRIAEIKDMEQEE